MEHLQARSWEQFLWGGAENPYNCENTHLMTSLALVPTHFPIHSAQSRPISSLEGTVMSPAMYLTAQRACISKEGMVLRRNRAPT